MTTKTKWPETVIFWGAGATMALGFPTTRDQGDLLIKLSEASSHDDCFEKLRELHIFSEQYAKELADLLCVLDDDPEPTESERMITKISPEQFKRARVLFSQNDDEIINDLVVNLRSTYDFAALKQILTLCAKDNQGIVMTVFNLIDYHAENNEGFVIGKVHIDKRRLLGARNALIMLIVSSMTGAYLKALDAKQELIRKYKGFAKALASYMQNEGEDRSGLPPHRRNFYLFSYAVISLNWDHFFNWMIFHAHKDFNDDPRNDCFDGRHIRLKLFNDFAILMGLRELRKNEGEKLSENIWYPYNETVAQRINDPDYDHGKIVRIGKYYYPHGCVAWRNCPNCGSLTGSFGDDWDEASDSLFPPGLIPVSRKIANRSKLEKENFKQGRFDLISCSYCGAKTELKDTPLITQTSVKGNILPALRMIQADINACLENAEHIIFMGYSLPPDDMVWRSILLARKNKVKVSVVVGTGGPGRWQYSSEAPNIIGGDTDINKRFFELFKVEGQDPKENLRFYTKGIPDIFDDVEVEDLMKWG